MLLITGIYSWWWCSYYTKASVTRRYNNPPSWHTITRPRPPDSEGCGQYKSRRGSATDHQTQNQEKVRKPIHEIAPLSLPLVSTSSQVLHRAHCWLPCPVAHLISHTPQLVSAAVHALCDRDSEDTKVRE